MIRFPARILKAAIVAGAMTLGAGVASASDLIVKYDQSQLIRLPRAVSEIIIGNPSIAEVSVQSNNLLVVTGKTFGTTNVIALDADRNVIADQRIIVIQDQARQVSLFRGGKRETYSCAPTCGPALMIGDDPVFFEQTKKAAEGKTKFSGENNDGN